jgi:hypothetical protein
MFMMPPMDEGNHGLDRLSNMSIFWRGGPCIGLPHLSLNKFLVLSLLPAGVNLVLYRGRQRSAFF